MTYDNTNKGTLGKNHRKEKDTQPSHTGKCDIDGKMYWISAWVKDGNNGEKFFSLAFKPQEVQAPKPAPAPTRGSGTGFDQMDDDVPF